jgi:phosphotransferase system HPr (HPr) family protein
MRRVRGKRDIHLSPATEIAAVANRFPCSITIRRGEKTADAKSVLDMLLLTAEEGAELLLVAVGPQSDAALDALGEILAKRG